jgi:malate dehydrogenase (oxaloacetate-decarboxylating)(NADP+)
MATQRDLSLAYSPGVAVPVQAIAEDPPPAYDYTAKGNLVAVISNGTAILGLGNLGALASKPVMEGKAVLFKRFADVDSIDIEVDTEDPTSSSTRCADGPTFGGINLEDIKAPECFIIEQRCASCMTFRCSTTTSTAPRSSRRRPDQRLHLTGRDIKDVEGRRQRRRRAGIACSS